MIRKAGYRFGRRLLLFSIAIFIGITLTAISSVEASWARGVWVPCSKCHPTEPRPIQVVAAETVDYALCIYCHKETPVDVTAEVAHKAHAGILIGLGDWLKHKTSEEAKAVGKDIADCLACHFRVTGKDCMLVCHAKKMPHVGDRTDCDTCHGATPKVEAHEIKLVAHEKLGPVPAACYACHEATNLDKFALVTGIPVAYSEAPRLCYQCHSEYYRAWKEGKHHSPVLPAIGSCTDRECHNPHSPYLPPPATFKEYVELLPLPLDFTLMGVLIAIVVVLLAAIFYCHRPGIILFYPRRRK